MPDIDAFEPLWREFCDKVGPTLVAAMSEEAPRDTGMLADETQGWREEDGHLYIESTDDRGPIAAYNILGTAPHEIVPVNANYLHFIAADGKEVFTKHVDHPGTEPNPYNQRAWENVKDEVVTEFVDTVGRGVLLAYLNPWRRTI